MRDVLLRLYVHQLMFSADQPTLRERIARSEAGEGVISPQDLDKTIRNCAIATE